MKKFKNVIVALLVLIMGTLSGCAAFQKFDASGYTKACLDATYKGEFDEYIKLTKQTKEDAEKTITKLRACHTTVNSCWCFRRII